LGEAIRCNGALDGGLHTSTKTEMKLEEQPLGFNETSDGECVLRVYKSLPSTWH
jgi:hypothetical protein